jgi:hypothetical protein
MSSKPAEMPNVRIDELTVDVHAPNDGARRTNTVRWLLDNDALAANGKRLADLGAGPCVFAKIARDRGYDVVAVDGRTERLPDDSELHGIRFLQADVRDFDPTGFDVIFILGLLYHFDIDDQLALLRTCASGPKVLVDTQVHVPELIALRTKEGWEERIVQRGGYEGVEFPEGDNPMASIGNPKSFWHTEESLLKLFVDAGFDRITKISPIFQSKYGGRRFYILESRRDEALLDGH